MRNAADAQKTDETCAVSKHECRQLVIREKLILVFVCVCLTACGSVYLGIGIYMRGDTVDATSSLVIAALGQSSTLVAGSYIMIIIGVSAFATAFVGCFAVWEQKPWQFLVFIGGRGEVILLSLVCFILSAVFYANVRYRIPDLAWKSYKADVEQDDSARLEEVWDPLQTKLRCCGIQSYQDFEKIRLPILRGSGQLDVVLPKSCCVSDMETNLILNLEKCRLRQPRYLYITPCLEAMEKEITQNSGLLMLTTLYIVFIEIPALVLMKKFYNKVRRSCQQEQEEEEEA